jgi:pimeloyl-ACP methyl ester carboxylesterase
MTGRRLFGTGALKSARHATVECHAPPTRSLPQAWQRDGYRGSPVKALADACGLSACPTLFVTGSDHPEWPPERAESACRLLAAGSVAVVPDTSYLTPLEWPEATIERLRALWAHPLPRPAPA